MKRVICLFVSLSVIVVACKKDKEDPDPSGGVDCSTVTYSGTIAAIVTNKCNTAGCHNAGSGNGDYTSYAGIKAKYDNGSLKQRVLVEKTMPQGTTLSSTEYSQFECWVNAGAPQN